MASTICNIKGCEMWGIVQRSVSAGQCLVHVLNWVHSLAKSMGRHASAEKPLSRRCVYA